MENVYEQACQINPYCLNIETTQTHLFLIIIPLLGDPRLNQFFSALRPQLPRLKRKSYVSGIFQSLILENMKSCLYLDDYTCTCGKEAQLCTLCLPTCPGGLSFRLITLCSRGNRPVNRLHRFLTGSVKPYQGHENAYHYVMIFPATSKGSDKPAHTRSLMSLEYSMSAKLLTEHQFKFLSLRRLHRLV